MSLNNISHPSVKHCADKVNARYIHGRPESELVPSRYALRVGELDVLVVSDGVLSLPGAMLGHNVDPAVRAAWLEDMFLPPDVLEWALNVVVVRSGGRTILIDVGIGMEFPDLPRAGKLAQRLKAAGIDPASVTPPPLSTSPPLRSLLPPASLTSPRPVGHSAGRRLSHATPLGGRLMCAGRARACWSSRRTPGRLVAH